MLISKFVSFSRYARAEAPRGAREMHGLRQCVVVEVGAHWGPAGAGPACRALQPSSDGCHLL